MLQREEEEARRAAELERKRKEREAAKQRRREQLGEDYVSEEEEEEEKEVEEEEGGGEAEEVKHPKGPSPILSAFYCSQDSREFWVSMVSVSVLPEPAQSVDVSIILCCRVGMMLAISTDALWREPGHRGTVMRLPTLSQCQHSAERTCLSTH